MGRVTNEALKAHAITTIERDLGVDVDAAHQGVCSLALDMRHFTQRAHELGRALTGFGPEPRGAEEFPPAAARFSLRRGPMKA